MENILNENPIMAEEESKNAIDFLVNTLNFDTDFITVTKNFNNLKFGIEYMIRLGKALSNEFTEWCENTSNNKEIYVRVIFFHPTTQKSYLEAIIKAGLVLGDNNEYNINKNYYLRKMPELELSVFEDENFMSEDSEENTTFKTLNQDMTNLVNIDQKLFWDIIKYLVYHESILEYKILVEQVNNK
jgi:hypothetical protein